MVWKANQWGWESRTILSMLTDCFWERVVLLESGVWMGGSILPKLNIVPRSIAYKYREGNMKRTLKRELKGPEIADMKAHWIYHEKLASVCCFTSLCCIFCEIHNKIKETVRYSVWSSVHDCFVSTNSLCQLWKKVLRMLLVARYSVGPVLKHGPRSLTFVQVCRIVKPASVVKANVVFIQQYTQMDLLILYRECGLSWSSEIVCVGAHPLGPERWWTMLGQGEARGNSGGSS